MARTPFREYTIYVRKKTGISVSIDGTTNNVYSDDYITIEEVVLNTMSSTYEFLTYGEKTKNMQVAYLDYDEYFGKLEAGDIVYLFDKVPFDEEYVGANANYIIDGVFPQNIKVKIVFDKLP